MYFHKIVLFSNPLLNLPEENEEEQPKIYSWDKKKTDLSEFIFENLNQQEVSKLPGSINGQQFIIRNCENSSIYIFDHVNRE